MAVSVERQRTINATRGQSPPRREVVPRILKMSQALLRDCGNKDAQLIKLADRMHNMETLDNMPPKKQRQKAQETVDYFLPVAQALGPAYEAIRKNLATLAERYLGQKKD